MHEKQENLIPFTDDAIVYQHHRFSNDILRRVHACYKTDNWHGPRECLEDWLVIGICIWVSSWAWSNTSLPIALLIYGFAVFLIGGRQRALADILHQAAHQTLARTRWWNFLWGTFLSGYPIMQSFSGYYSSHIVFHHGSFGHRKLDPDYVHLINHKVYGENRNQKEVKRYLLGIFSPTTTLSYLKYLLLNRFWCQDEKIQERWVRFSYLGILFGTIVYLGWGLELLAYWFIPLITTQAWIGNFIELLEHYPMMEKEPSIDIFMSRNRHVGWLSNFLLGIQQYEGYHIVHHKFPKVPPWRNIEVHQILMEDPTYQKINDVKPGWKNLIFELINDEQSSVAFATHQVNSSSN